MHTENSRHKSDFSIGIGALFLISGLIVLMNEIMNIKHEIWLFLISLFSMVAGAYFMLGMRIANKKSNKSLSGNQQ